MKNGDPKTPCLLVLSRWAHEQVEDDRQFLVFLAIDENEPGDYEAVWESSRFGAFFLVFSLPVTERG
jgi:hypothetical protein